jgi:hypothetical protein
LQSEKGNEDMKMFKRHRDSGFWDQDLCLSKISKPGDSLERLSDGIDFETFRVLLEQDSIHTLPSLCGTLRMGTVSVSAGGAALHLR